MYKLDEQIDFILEQSLDEYVKARDWQGYAKPGLAADKEKKDAEAAEKKAQDDIRRKKSAEKVAKKRAAAKKPFYQPKGEECVDYVEKKSEYLEDDGMSPAAATDAATAAAKEMGCGPYLAGERPEPGKKAAAEKEKNPFYQMKGKECGDFVEKKAEYFEEEGLPPKVARDEAISAAKEVGCGPYLAGIPEADKKGAVEKALSGEDPEGSSKILDNAQAALDVLGLGTMIPFPPIIAIGEAATVASFIMNTARGKYAWALFDLFAMIPIAGGAAKAGKLGKTAKTASTAAKWKSGRTMIKVLGSAKNARKATTAVKAASTASKVKKAAESGVDLILEIIPDSLMKKFVNAEIPDALKPFIPDNLENQSFVDFMLEISKNIPMIGDKIPEVQKVWDEVKIASDATSSPQVRYKSATGSKRVEPRQLEEGDLVEIVIDLEELKQNSLNESFLAMFGGWVEQILGSMFSGRSLPLSVKGSQGDVESFAKALGGEKSYLEAARRYGLDHPTTYKSKSKLENAIKGFEKDTGIKWPIK